MHQTKEDARGKWHSILSVFIDKKFLTGNHGPCPICGGKDRFRWDNRDGNGSYYCSSCGPGTGIHLLAQVLNISHADAWKKVEAVVGTATPENQRPAKTDDMRRDEIKKILASCRRSTNGDDVGEYLAGRGIIDIPGSIFTGNHKGMSCMVTRFAKGKIMSGLHVTYIRDGIKIEDNPRKMYGAKDGGLPGSAIRLHQLGDGTELIIAEGVETALSASILFGRPAWATGCAQFMERVEIPDFITSVIICGDNDASFTGQCAAYILAKRLWSKKKNVIIRIPENVGEDWNDALKNKKDGR